jgi:hypothetical protein
MWLVEVSQVLDDLITSDKHSNQCADCSEYLGWAHFGGMILRSCNCLANDFDASSLC